MIRVVAGAALLAACGRVDFAPRGDAPIAIDAPAGPCDAAAIAAAPFATPDAPYLICTPDQLDAVGAHSELWGAAFVLGADLDVTARAPVPSIGNPTIPFDGTFDGGGHTITGLHYDETADEVGLFALIDPSAHLANLTLAAVNVHGTGKFTGALVGYGQGALIENIAIDGTIVGSQSVGGAIGGIECYHQAGITPCPDGIVIRNVAVDVNVTGTGAFDGTGGIIGYTYSELPTPAMLTDLAAAGSVTGKAVVGGIGGDMELFVLDGATSSATIMADRDAGGVLGDVSYSSSIIRHVHASGDVTCTSGACGGAIATTDGCGVSQSSASGKVKCMLDTCGGFAGDIENTVDECYATGAVSGRDGIGGLVGYALAITDSFATGQVTGRTSVGGLAGQTTKDISRVYATGLVVASGEYAGGLLGEIASGTTIASSFATGNVAGVSPAGNVGRIIGGPSGTAGYTSSNNFASNTCTNTGGTCTTNAETSVAPASYFWDPASAPMSSWDFTSVWQVAASAPPALRDAP